MSKKRVLIGSPIHQKADILQEFLISLSELENESFEIDFCFVDDNEDEQSSQLLKNFFVEESKKIILENSIAREHYECNEEKHIWNEKIIWKVASFKNEIIRIALTEEYDYLFLVDSDLVLHPQTIGHLINTGKDIVSNIFWTKWDKNSNEIPQVWLSDQYTLYFQRRGEQLSAEEKYRRYHQFIIQLTKPGLYEVGGLGACTLISRNALEKGVNFNEIKNISFWGEDRHFCIRASALGFSLFVDTHFPAYHIYRESDLSGVSKYKEDNKTREIDILHYYILEHLRRGIESIGHFHYQNGYEKSWSQYFVPSFAEKLFAHMEASLPDEIQKQKLAKATVSNAWVESVDLETSLALVKFVLTEIGMENGQKYHRSFQCDAQLALNPHNEWLIVYFEVNGEIKADEAYETYFSTK